MKFVLLEVLRNEFVHLLSGLVVSLIVFKITGDFNYALLTFLINLFIDVDHLFDYSLAYFKHKPTNKIYLFFHGWEWVLFFLFLLLFTKNPIFLALFMGILNHYIVDVFTNHVKPIAYFLTYRLKRHFALEAFSQNKF